MDLKDFSVNHARLPKNQRDADKTNADEVKAADDDGLKLKSLYEPDPKIWWKQQPYTFVFNKEDVSNEGGLKYAFNLPISPSNISITTHFATNIVTTMYGTVEEHSEQRYFDINIAGTTGMSPYYSSPKKVIPINKSGELTKVNDVAVKEYKSTRATFSAASSISKLGASGFFKRTANIAETVASQAKDIFNNDKPEGISVENINTGYMAFHNFYRFLLKYKEHTSSRSPNQPKNFHPLTFINWKDGNQYDVVITNFQLLREANNPMLYNYNISMRAYNLKRAGASLEGYEADQIDLLKSLGLDKAGGSIKAQLARKARSAKNAAYAAIALTKVAGQ